LKALGGSIKVGVKRSFPGMIFVFVCSFGILLAVSWLPLWKVELPGAKLSEMDSGNFWDFLENLPRATKSVGVPQTPNNILTMLPTVFLWSNIRTTLMVLVAGALLGLLVWSYWSCQIRLVFRSFFYYTTGVIKAGLPSKQAKEAENGQTKEIS